MPVRLLLTPEQPHRLIGADHPGAVVRDAVRLAARPLVGGVRREVADCARLEDAGREVHGEPHALRGSVPLLPRLARVRCPVCQVEGVVEAVWA